jgi:hypothetical protein
MCGYWALIEAEVERREVRLRSVSARRVMPCFARAKAADCPIPGEEVRIY